MEGVSTLAEGGGGRRRSRRRKPIRQGRRKRNMRISKIRISGKRKKGFIEQNMTGNIDFVGCVIKANIPFRQWRITKKDTWGRPRL